jgi:Ca2+ transporting ATPase
MCVKNILIIEDNDPSKFTNLSVDGSSYSFNEKIHEMEKYCKDGFPQNLKTLVEIMSQCNDGYILKDEKTNSVVPAGLPTEVALKTLVEKISFYDSKFTRNTQGNLEQYGMTYNNNQKRVVTLEFTRERRGMSVLQNNKLLIKGSPDYII